MPELSVNAVLSALSARGTRALHVSEILKRLELPRGQRDRLAQTLAELVDDGRVRELPGQRFRALRRAPGRRALVQPQQGGAAGRTRPSRQRRGARAAAGAAAAHAGSRSNRSVELPPRSSRRDESAATEGRLSVHPRGFGFVSTVDGGPDAFIPPHALRGALHGDWVELRSWPSAKGRDGEITCIRRGSVRMVTGQVRLLGGRCYLDPDDSRLPGPMPFAEPPPKALLGDGERVAQKVVMARIAEFPLDGDDVPTVVFVDVLGEHGEAEVEVAKIKIQEGVVEVFPDEVVEEARRLPAKVRPSDRKGRTDLRELPLVTIDPDDARDHDDALWATRLPQGGYRLVVAIADVSHYVPEGGAIDTEARGRGCSIYLPDRAIPMLPPELSSHLASLVPKRDRLCLALDVELGVRGKVRRVRILEGVMRSRARLTYTDVAQALGLGGQKPTVGAACRAHMGSLEALYALSRMLRKLRSKRGNLELDVPEPRVRLEGTTPSDVVRSKGNESMRHAYQLVEEMMLLANETIAQELTRQRLPTVYRVHGNPKEEKLVLFVRLAQALGFDVELESMLQPGALADVTRRLQDHPQASILNFLLLRSMQQATYDIHNIGHFGLGAPAYLHFTSPIRRYPDLAVHRLVRGLLRDEEFDEAQLRHVLQRAAFESSRSERRAMNVERAVLDLYRTLVMRKHVGETLPATVSMVESYGLICTLDAPFVEVFVPMERLDGSYELDDLGLRLFPLGGGPGYAVGDRVSVSIEEANIARRRVFGVPVAFLAAGALRANSALPEQAAPDKRDRRADRASPSGAQAGTRAKRAKASAGSKRAALKRQAKGGKAPVAAPKNTQSRNAQSRNSQTKSGTAPSAKSQSAQSSKAKSQRATKSSATKTLKKTRPKKNTGPQKNAGPQNTGPEKNIGPQKTKPQTNPRPKTAQKSASARRAKPSAAATPTKTVARRRDAK